MKKRNNQRILEFKLLIFLTLVLFLPICSNGASLATEDPVLTSHISSILGQDRYSYAHWGILVSDSETGRDLILKDTEALFCPGSTTKLFTAAALLKILGPDYRFETPVYTNGKIIDGSVLDGYLILKASGDPNMGGRAGVNETITYTSADHGDANALGTALLTSEDPLAGLKELARQVKASGIRQADNVVIDDRLFDIYRTEKHPPVSPIIINDNVIDLTITPTDKNTLAAVSMRPSSSIFFINNSVKTVRDGEAEIDIQSVNQREIRVMGTIPEDSVPVNRTFQINDPSSFARSLFIEALEDEGVIITGDTGGENPVSLLEKISSYSSLSEVSRYISPPLSEEIKMGLKVSQNLHADTWVMLMASHEGKRNFEDGMVAEMKALEDLGVDTTSISLSDGEGGEWADLLSPRTSVQLLTRMKDASIFSPYFQALPVMGVDGTLTDLVPSDDPSYGKVYAKTGTSIGGDLLNQRGILLGKALSGYISTKNDRLLTFGIFINNVPIESLSDIALINQDIARITGFIQQYY